MNEKKTNINYDNRIYESPKKRIIFDLDNTLLFISNNWIETYQKFINKYNLDISIEELYDAIDNVEKNYSDNIINNDYFIKYINERLSINITKEIFEDLLDCYADIPLLYTDVIYDILDYLSKKYELIVYSNWFTENQIKRLKKYNLEKFFTEIYGWDILPIKPSQKGIRKIIKNNNIENYIFIGDSIKFDLELPKSMGMDTIFYNRKKIKQDKYKEIIYIEDLKNIL